MLTGLPDLNLKSTQLKQNVYEYSFNYILKRKIQDTCTQSNSKQGSKKHSYVLTN